MQLLSQHLTVPRQGELRSHVRSIPRKAFLAVQRRDEHDAPLPLLHHVRLNPKHRIQRAVEVDRHRASDLLDGQLPDRTANVRTRVRHQNVDPSPTGQRLCHQVIHLFPVRHVRWHRQGFTSQLADLVSQLFQRRRSAGGQRHARSPLSQRQRRCPPNAAGRAGDDGDLIEQPERWIPASPHGHGLLDPTGTAKTPIAPIPACEPTTAPASWTRILSRGKPNRSASRSANSSAISRFRV